MNRTLWQDYQEINGKYSHLMGFYKPKDGGQKTTNNIGWPIWIKHDLLWLHHLSEDDNGNGTIILILRW
jgi:hypothetical protein